MTYPTREAWLTAFVDAARPQFASVGAPIPERVRVGVGFASRVKAIGQCWSSSCSDDETFEIFIHPGKADPSRVADILTHELVHAAVGLKHQHKRPFADIAKALGLEGKMTATVAGDAWRAWAEPLLSDLGAFPHATLNTSGTRAAHPPERGAEGAKGDAVTSAPPVQTNRHVKLSCDACDWQCRTTRKHYEGKTLTCPDLDCNGTLYPEA